MAYNNNQQYRFEEFTSIDENQVYDLFRNDPIVSFEITGKNGDYYCRSVQIGDGNGGRTNLTVGDYMYNVWLEPDNFQLWEYNVDDYDYRQGITGRGNIGIVYFILGNIMFGTDVACIGFDSSTEGIAHPTRSGDPEIELVDGSIEPVYDLSRGGNFDEAVFALYDWLCTNRVSGQVMVAGGAKGAYGASPYGLAGQYCVGDNDVSWEDFVWLMEQSGQDEFEVTFSGQDISAITYFDGTHMNTVHANANIYQIEPLYDFAKWSVQPGYNAYGPLDGVLFAVGSSGFGYQGCAQIVNVSGGNNAYGRVYAEDNEIRIQVENYDNMICTYSMDLRSSDQAADLYSLLMNACPSAPLFF